MIQSTITRSRLMLTVNLICASALLFGCGGGSSSGAPPVDPPATDAIAPGAQLVRSLGNQALVGQPYTSSVAVVPNDSRNAVTGLAVTNSTAGGAAPSIDASGVVTWTPNEEDFVNTLDLTITATLREGPPTTLVSPVSVRKERLVHQESLPAGAGRIADPGGRYLIQVEPETAGTSMSGTLSISEVYSTNGAFSYVVRVPTTSGARVTVLDAPETLVVAPRTTAAEARIGARTASGRPGRLSVKDAAPDLEANVGGLIGSWFTSGDGEGRVADIGEVKVYTTRGTPFTYALTLGGNQETRPADRVQVFQIDANCKDAASCAAIKSNDATPATRGPVILVHGFSFFQSVGGGEDTWGSLASALKASGHPVFELRWNTYMRFEEAAGVLSSLSKRVAQITGHKVTVVAHSFGGVVAHLSMMGKGIRYQGGGWQSVPVDGVFQRLITLGSPLSGIRLAVDGPDGLTAGRDDDDLFIAACEAITCFQAGSSDQWGTEEIGELEGKVVAIDPSRIGLSDAREGETIRTLHQAWKDGHGHAIAFTTVVSIKKRPFDDYAPDLTNATAYDLGDGLISIMGQAVVPSDFSAKPFGLPQDFDISGKLGSDFLNRLDQRHAANMEHVTQNGRDYYFALRAAHSSAQNIGVSYMIANYPDSGRVDVLGESPADHPLRYFIGSASHLAEVSAAYSGATEAPVAVVRAKLVLDGRPLSGEWVSFQLEDAASGELVSDTVVVASSASSGEVVFDAGQTLAARFPGRLLNVAGYKVLVRAGNGTTTARVFKRADLANAVELGAIDLTPTPANALVGAIGRVIDGQTEDTAIAGAEIYLMKGTGQSSDLLRLVRDTTTSRHLTADLLGLFATSGLEPGYYSALVTKPGYVDQTQGSLVVAADGSSVFVFSLVQVLAPDQGAITLRWGAATDGSLVSPDLDSHLQKFDAAGNKTYEIFYGNKVPNATDSLDRDDTDYQGPETVTLAVDSSARYVYFVYNYAIGYGPSLLGPSRPTVSIRIGALLREFSLPPGDVSTQPYWKVFEIINGVIVPCASNCLTDTSP